MTKGAPPISPITDSLLAAARQELGYAAQAGTQSKYGTWYSAGKDPSLASAPWCDTFVSYAGQSAGLLKQVGSFAASTDHAEWFRSKSAWTSQPQPGAIGFLKDHGQVGVVEKVADGKVTTIEALNGSVQRVTRPDSDFSGYGVPDQVVHPVYEGSTTASYFWDDGSGRNGDTGAPASGKPMQKGLAASPSWPMGTEGYVMYEGKKAPFFVGDRGPGSPSGSGIMLDLDGKTFADLTGGTFDDGSLTVEGIGGQGHIDIDYMITKWGDGLGKKGAPVAFSEGAYNERSVPAEPQQIKFKLSAAEDVTCAPNEAPIAPQKAAPAKPAAPQQKTAAAAPAPEAKKTVAIPSVTHVAYDTTTPRPETPVPVIASGLVACALVAVGMRFLIVQARKGRHEKTGA
ncbi:CHAP domain-containing protein [Herbidospora mongoliensis]|uniref:CHAP domain-containing protein n=1 Tax=Herbidospora mongoliensis TaxID=688067 RepID=UPI001471F22C